MMTDSTTATNAKKSMSKSINVTSKKTTFADQQHPSKSSINSNSNNINVVQKTKTNNHKRRSVKKQKKSMLTASHMY